MLVEERKCSEGAKVTKPKKFTKQNCRGENVELRAVEQQNSFARS